MPLHLTHVQFHSYGTEGDRKFSSGAAEIAEAVNRNKHISVDVGQIMFGQTVTASGDTMMQYRNRGFAKPRKWLSMDIECQGGCGLVPFRYRDRNFVNALQWAIGLELFLLVEDPWRIFLTTDHPNGAPFTMYPQLIRLLMDRSYRNDMLATINKAAAAASTLGSIAREYTLAEIAILTRAGPARILGLRDRGHLAPGAVADIAVYTEQADKAAMFGAARLRLQGRPPDRARRRAHRDGLGRHPCRAPVLRPRHRALAARSFRALPDRPPRQLRHRRRRDRGWRAGPPREIRIAGAGSVIINGVEIEDTFAEAFGMTATRLLITADYAGMGGDRGRQPHRLRHLRHRLRLRGRHRAPARAPTRRPTAAPASPC